MLSREMEYQARLNQQRQQLEKLLEEKQNLLEAHRQLTDIARSTFASKNEAENQVTAQITAQVSSFLKPIHDALIQSYFEFACCDAKTLLAYTPSLEE